MRMLDSPQQTPDENLRVLIKRGPDKKETSLKELEENYASTPEWKVIEGAQWAKITHFGSSRDS